jgi:hypothetical protein
MTNGSTGQSAMLEQACNTGKRSAITQVVYAEVSVRYSDESRTWTRQLAVDFFARLSIPWKAAFPSPARPLDPIQAHRAARWRSPLPDFFIGAPRGHNPA